MTKLEGQRRTKGASGIYGERNTFEDAKVTVTEFLDNFYDDSKDNYNQAFMNLERRLQEYFEYECRDTENDQQAVSEYVVYMDGAEWDRFPNRQDAEALVRLYQGEHSVWIEKEETNLCEENEK